MTTTPAFDYISGHLALDLANTVANRLAPDATRDLLRDADDIAAWAHASTHAELAQTVPKRGAKLDADAFERVIAVRDAIYRLSLAAIDGRNVPAAALQRLDAELRRCRSQQRLAARGGAIGWDFAPEATAGDRLLLPVLVAAVDLFASTERERIKQCDGPGCGWLFIDRSKTGQRRWCSMRDCGNRAKARRHYAKAAGGAD